MRIMNTWKGGVSAFIRRAEYEIAHAHPKPDRCCSDENGCLAWHWSFHDMELVVRKAAGSAQLKHPALTCRVIACRNSLGVMVFFRTMFILLGNDDQVSRISSECYRGP
jgi:hypothetical protein